MSASMGEMNPPCHQSMMQSCGSVWVWKFEYENTASTLIVEAASGLDSHRELFEQPVGQCDRMRAHALDRHLANELE